jgi:hypothetical protein
MTKAIAFLNVLHARAHTHTHTHTHRHTHTHFLENDTIVSTHKYSAYLLSEISHFPPSCPTHSTHFRNDMNVFCRKTRQFHKITTAYSCNFV